MFLQHVHWYCCYYLLLTTVFGVLYLHDFQINEWLIIFLYRNTFHVFKYITLSFQSNSDDISTFYVGFICRMYWCVILVCHENTIFVGRTDIACLEVFRNMLIALCWNFFIFHYFFFRNGWKVTLLILWFQMLRRFFHVHLFFIICSLIICIILFQLQ